MASPSVVVTEIPKAERVRPKEPDTLRTQSRKPAATSKRARTSVLPPLIARQTGLGLGSSLPEIGDVGLSGVEVSEVPAEPDQPARARRTVQPRYPGSAQRDGIEGFVTVRLNVDSNGRVIDVIVVDSEPIGTFEQSAREAVRRLEFVPARTGGKAVPTTVEKTIVFRLQ